MKTKIKVISCENKLTWYFKHIRDIFEVEREDSEYYWCLEKNLSWRCLNLIPKKDVVVIQ